METARLNKLRTVITENLRVQRGGAKPVPYIDASNTLHDAMARQNHVIFGRRGCGKTLLLHNSAARVDQTAKCVYLNCEDFKQHSFPNVLIEILDALFAELELHMSGWFGRKKRSKELIGNIRSSLGDLRARVDKRDSEVKETTSHEARSSSDSKLNVKAAPIGLAAQAKLSTGNKTELETRYRARDEKIEELNKWLPELKRQIRELFELSKLVSAVFLQIDDFYHLNRIDQPFVMDYVHRLCKDLPLYFKVGTLRHTSILYADRAGQPIGAQERHDYQPINIDFTLADLRATEQRNRKIFHEFAGMANIDAKAFDGLFMGEGFNRLVLAGGGVPRDCLSLFLEVLARRPSTASMNKIGKDDIRILSRSNFERRIEELKQDSAADDQDALIRAIYVLRRFCIDRQSNVFLISEQVMQQHDRLRDLIYRLLDYRIVHNAGSALTHKSQKGTYQALAIDIGCYAHMRKLDGRFNEIDLTAHDAKERMRSAPLLRLEDFDTLWGASPPDAEAALRAEDDEATERQTSNI